MRLPEDINTPDGLRIADFLRLSENASLDMPSLNLTLYGSAAVSLYLADEPAPEVEIHYAKDIDIITTGSSDKPPSFSLVCPPNTSPLHFQVNSIDLWLIHPEWEQACVNFSNLIGLRNWQIWALSPRDLILSKLIRYIRDDNERDVVDCPRLAARYLSSKTVFTQDLEEALKYHAPSVTPENSERLTKALNEIFKS